MTQDSTPKPPTRMDRLEAKIDAVIDRLPEPAPDTGWTSGLHRRVRWFEGMWATRLLASLGIWLFLATLIGLYYESRIRAEERVARTEEAEFRKLAQVATAWEVLLTPAGGDIGKGNALNTLVKAGNRVINTDLSCQTVGTWRANRCVNPPVFSGLKLHAGDNLWDEPQRDAPIIVGVGVRNYHLQNVNFDGAVITDLRASSLSFLSGFDNVRGSGWIVRNGFSGAREMDWARGTRDFVCRDCAFYQSRLDWPFMEGLFQTTISDSFVGLSSQAKLRISELAAQQDITFGHRASAIDVAKSGRIMVNDANSFGFGWLTTHLSHPVVFVNFPWRLSEETASDFMIGARNLTSVDDVVDRVHMPLYENLNYCVSKSDFAALAPYIASEISLGLAATQSLEAAYSEGAVSAYRAGLHSGKWADWGAGRQMLGPRSTRPVIYKCGFRFQDVKPVLMQRLLEALSE